MFLEFLYEALGSPHGIVLQSENRDLLRAKLYKAKRDACDTALDVLALIPSPTMADELWIVKKELTE